MMMSRSSSSSSSTFTMLVSFVTAALLSMTSAETIAINWAIPSSSAGLTPITASVGDVLEFTFIGTHNVHIHPGMTCDLTGSIEIGSSSPTTYTVTDADVGQLYFACEVGSHCNLGQHITVTVEAAVVPDTPAPVEPGSTPAPVMPTTPTEAPVAAPSPPPTSSAPLPKVTMMMGMTIGMMMVAFIGL